MLKVGDLTDLESMMGASIPCQFEHKNTVCSVEVTHRSTATCSGDTGMICTTAADVTLARIQESRVLPDKYCRNCDRAIVTCWRVLPC